MSVPQKEKLLVTYDLYKTAYNGVNLPVLNDNDLDNGITTIEAKFDKYSTIVQRNLNAVLGGRLSVLNYDWDEIAQPGNMYVLQIIGQRLDRAFHNDEIIERDSSVQYSESGGVQYTSEATRNAKNAIYAFWNGQERILIDRIRDKIRGSEFEAGDEALTEDNQFKDGPRVPEVAIGDYQLQDISINGVPTTVTLALQNLSNNKVEANKLLDEIESQLGLKRDAAAKTITVATGETLTAEEYKQNKGDNDFAQFKDISDSEARSRQDIVTNQKAIAKNANGIAANREAIDILNSIEFENAIKAPVSERALTSASNTTATFDLKTITADDGNGNQVQLYTDFSDDVVFTIELNDPNVGGHHAETFDRNKSGTYNFADGNQSDTFVATISDQGILTITRTNGNTNPDDLTLTDVIQKGSDIDTNRLIALINLRIKKQLIQGANADFETFAEFKALINDNDFVSVSFASGAQVSGIVTDSGKGNADDSVSVTGQRIEAMKQYLGLITIDKAFIIAGGSNLTDELNKKANITLANIVDAVFKDKAKQAGVALDDLSNVNLGVANAGKEFVVDIDGKIKLIDPIDFAAEYKYEIDEPIFAKPGTARAAKLKKLVDTNKAVVYLTDGATIIGGSVAGTSKGSIPATTATQAGHKHIGGMYAAATTSEWARYGTEGSSKGNSSNGGETGKSNPYTSTETPAITIHQIVAHNADGAVRAEGTNTYAVLPTVNISFADWKAL